MDLPPSRTGRVKIDFARKLERQRDTLKEALEKILDYQGRFGEEDPESIATEALQSLNQNVHVDLPPNGQPDFKKDVPGG